MFRAIGFVIVLYAISHLLGNAFVAFENAIVQTFGAFEAAAVQSQRQFESID